MAPTAILSAPPNAAVGFTKIIDSPVELHAGESQSLLESEAIALRKRGQQAVVDGKYELAKSFFEKALEVFDAQPQGDAQSRLLFENDLKNIRTLMQTVK